MFPRSSHWHASEAAADILKPSMYDSTYFLRGEHKSGEDRNVMGGIWIISKLLAYTRRRGIATNDGAPPSSRRRVHGDAAAFLVSEAFGQGDLQDFGSAGQAAPCHDHLLVSATPERRLLRRYRSDERRCIHSICFPSIRKAHEYA